MKMNLQAWRMATFKNTQEVKTGNEENHYG